MKIELDTEADVLYIELRAGEVADTLDLAEGVHLDVDDLGYVLGVEFLSLGALTEHVRRNGGVLDVPDRVLDLEEVLKQSEARADFLAELGIHNPAQRRVLELRYMQGLSSEEIAQVLDVSVATVRKHFSAALKEALAAVQREREPTGSVAIAERGRLLAK